MAGHDDFLDRFFAAIEAGDIDTVAECYADDVVVWNNLARENSTKADNLKLLTWWHGRVDGIRYEIVERIPCDGGVVQRHVIHGSVDGDELDVPCCIVFRIADDEITSLHEYLDQAALGNVFG